MQDIYVCTGHALCKSQVYTMHSQQPMPRCPEPLCSADVADQVSGYVCAAASTCAILPAQDYVVMIVALTGRSATLNSFCSPNPSRSESFVIVWLVLAPLGYQHLQYSLQLPDFKPRGPNAGVIRSLEC